MGKSKVDEFCIAKWENVILEDGLNEICAKINNKKVRMSDSFQCRIIK